MTLEAKLTNAKTSKELENIVNSREVTLNGDMAQQFNDMNEEHDFMDDMDDIINH